MAIGDVRLFNVGDYISGMESPMAVSWLLCVVDFWRPAYIRLSVRYIYIQMYILGYGNCVYVGRSWRQEGKRVILRASNYWSLDYRYMRDSE